MGDSPEITVNAAARYRGLASFFAQQTWGSAALHPRLYAVARYRGLGLSRFHIVDDRDTVPTVGEIWATSDHAVESHAHSADELLYVLSGAIAVNGRRLGSNEVVFIPGGASHSVRVITNEGARVLRIELPNAASRDEGTEYEARVWQGPLTDDGVPQLGPASEKDVASR